ncbi:acyltransferase domain-containing protein [Lacrimispora sp.]|uniref:acyltransferase domain-containing protein n=1 Tax=Lacrimispora sp. TaxID=2719234 RepID=UPI0032E405B9
MTKLSIFSEDTQAAVDFFAAAYESNEYFMRNYSRCRELLLVEKDPEGAAEAVMFGIRHARLLHMDDFLLPVIYIDWMLPELVHELEKQGIPEAVIQDSFKDVEIWIQSYRKYHEGQVGLDRVEWVFRSLAGKVRRFGSLQFEEVTYEFPFLIFENRQSGEFQALACPDLLIDQDGSISGTNGRSVKRETKTYLDFGDRALTGYRVDLKSGTVKMESPVLLNTKEWELKLAPGEKTVAVHIPEGSDLSSDSIDSSFCTAKNYYDNQILVCDSWLLDPHLEHILPEHSKIISFMNRFHKMPVLTGRPQILERVMGFDFTMEELEQFSCTTSLQASLKKYLLDGNEMFTTAGFMLWR